MAGRIFVTGDCHGDFRRFNMASFPEQKELDRDDYMIICGDFGGIWNREESREEEYWLDWLDRKSYTTLFVDGNHENFDRLNSYPVREWKGGRVHEIRPSLLHLMRGQIFCLGGKSFFTFGGASSHDIAGGILEPEDPDFRGKKRRLDQEGALYRVRHISWWEEELADEREMEEGRENLEKAGYRVDYIITHCCATGTQEELGGRGLYDADRETDYLEYIRNHTAFTRWFFGHYHMDGMVNDREVLLYEQIVEAD
ncbi:MAG: metallophosphoesterase [Roseburia sp.]|nr:metallophosphoesterase [Roseburia sp.]MCM1097646.1 metallophosphoesterase [Ruminococcus flavefaciens]